jgi:hypothetical protein
VDAGNIVVSAEEVEEGDEVDDEVGDVAPTVVAEEASIVLVDETAVTAVPVAAGPIVAALPQDAATPTAINATAAATT